MQPKKSPFLFSYGSTHQEFLLLIRDVFFQLFSLKIQTFIPALYVLYRVYTTELYMDIAVFQ